MDLDRVRRLLAQGRAVLRFADHAIIEGRKDGLTSADIEEAVFHGEIIEDYGTRGFSYTSRAAMGYRATSC